ncbi:MAG: response regulator [Minicystis sp.]
MKDHLPAPPSSRRGARRVLIADDDADLREVLAEVLRDEGWDVSEARDGEEAFAILMAETFDAVVLDHRMPRMTGSDVCLALAAAGRRAPIILVTAAERVAELAASLGIRWYLGKPFQLTDLIALLDRTPQLCS